MFAIAKNGVKCQNFNERSQIKVFLVPLITMEMLFFIEFLQYCFLYSEKIDRTFFKPSSQKLLFMTYSSVLSNVFFESSAFFVEPGVRFATASKCILDHRPEK